MIKENILLPDNKLMNEDKGLYEQKLVAEVNAVKVRRNSDVVFGIIDTDVNYRVGVREVLGLFQLHQVMSALSNDGRYIYKEQLAAYSGANDTELRTLMLPFNT